MCVFQESILASPWLTVFCLGSCTAVHYAGQYGQTLVAQVRLVSVVSYLPWMTQKAMRLSQILIADGAQSMPLDNKGRTPLM